MNKFLAFYSLAAQFRHFVFVIVVPLFCHDMFLTVLNQCNEQQGRGN